MKIVNFGPLPGTSSTVPLPFSYYFTLNTLVWICPLVHVHH